MLYHIDDPRFRQLFVASAGLDRLYTGARWTEGPVWFADMNCLLFSDIPNNRMLRFCPDPQGSDGMGNVSVFRAPSGFANGHSRDLQGRLISCEHGARRVSRTGADGSITVLADSFEGKKLNSPNDLVVADDGAIWFTDPTYGIMSDYEGYRAEPEQAARNVFRLDPVSGALSSVCDDFNQPNGLCFSPDFRKLYIADSGASHDPSVPAHIRVFDVDGARLSGGGEFARIDAGVPDGICADSDGRIWSSAADGVHCFDPGGDRLGKILVPEVTANLCFGGPRRNRMYITATRSLYAISLCVNGAQTP